MRRTYRKNSKLSSFFEKVNFIRRPFFSLFTLAILSGCASENLKNSENPEVVYNEAVRLIDKGRYLEATEYLNEIRLRFPQSRFYALADLRTGDLYFKQDSFTEAAAAYGTFADLYPTHAEAPYALYQKALSYFNDTPELSARDQSPASEASKSADFLIKKFPKSEFSTKAQEIKIKSRLRLAQKEAYIAQFYERRGAKIAAQKRWKGIVDQFSDLESYSDEAKNLLAEARSKSDSASKPVSGT